MKVSNYETTVRARCNNCKGEGTKTFKDAFDSGKDVKVECDVCEGVGRIIIHKKTTVTMTPAK